jgi:hypothetical protein
MLAHALAVLALLGTALVILLGAGALLFGLARGDWLLARRAAIGTAAVAALYLAGVAASAGVAPTRVLPVGGELDFCGFDCHLHISVLGSETDMDRVGVFVTARSDARREPEYPQYLRFRLVGKDGTVLVPDNEARAFRRPLPAGDSYLDSLYFTTPGTGFPYTLRVTYPGPIDALLLGPANSGAVGKTTLALGGTTP